MKKFVGIFLLSLIISVASVAQLPVTDASAAIQRTKQMLTDRILAQKSEAAHQARFAQMISKTATTIKYAMETAGVAKQIYGTGESALRMLKSAFGDAKSMGDIMALYSMGQLKLINLHNQWERDNSNYTDLNSLYLAATSRYRFQGQIDPYRIIAVASQERGSLTEATQRLFNLKQQSDYITKANLINSAENLERRAQLYEEMASRLALLSTSMTIAGSGGNLQNWLDKTAKMQEQSNSAFLAGLHDNVQGLVNSSDATLGKLLKNELDKYAEKNNISPEMVRNIDATIANYRFLAANDRTTAQRLRQNARELRPDLDREAMFELQNQMSLEDPILNEMGIM